MIFQSGYNYYNGNRSVLNYMDGSVGLMGLGNSALLQWSSYGTPIIGQAVAAYSFSRLYYDCVVVPNVQQIQSNVNRGSHPLQGVYVPALGDFYTPAIWGY